MTNVRFPFLSSKFQQALTTSFVFLSLNFTVSAHELTFRESTRVTDVYMIYYTLGR